MLISEEYRSLNTTLHATKPNYGTSGATWAPLVNQLAREVEAKTILDYGSGKGLLKQALEVGRWTHRMLHPDLPFEILEYDPAIPGKETKPKRADVVVCGDVLEHIEPECLDDVLDDIRDIARKRVLLVVATRTSNRTLPDGRNTHLIVEEPRWWLPKIIARWDLLEFKNGDKDGKFMCIGAPR